MSPGYLDPCDVARDARQRAEEEGAEAGRLLLPAGLNPYTGTRHHFLASYWEGARLESAAKHLEKGNAHG